MKWIAIIFGVLAALFLGLLFIAPGLVPSETYKTRIQEQLTRELGRDVRIEGDVSLSTFPVIKAKTGRATIANPPDFSRDLLASIEGLEARIKLWPLLSRRVEIASFTLTQPDILLERRADGEVNWQIGEPLQEAPAEPSGPFKRDGRYANIDPSLGAFALENGRVFYRDAVQNREIDIEAINANLSLPSLESEFDLDGTFTLDGQSVALDLTLDSPRAFLNGQAAKLEGEIEATAGTLSLDGTLPASQDISFVGDIDADVTDIAFFERLLPEPIPALSLLETVSVSATAATGQTANATRFDALNLEANGPDIAVTFNGAAGMTEAINASGRYTLEGKNAAKIGSVIAPSVTGLDIVSNFESAGQIELSGTDISVTDMTAEASGPDLSASFTGNAAVTETVNLSGRYAVNVGNVSKIGTVFALDINGLDAISTLESEGQVQLSGTDISVTNMTADLSGPDFDIDASGDAGKTGDRLSGSGNFNMNISQFGPLIRQFVPDMTPDADILGQVITSGNFALQGQEIVLSDLNATTASETLNTDYKGAVTVAGTTPTLDGTFSATVNSVDRLNKAISTEIPYATSVGKIAISGLAKGTPDNLSMTELNATLSEGDINGQYTGSATVSAQVALNGRLSVASDTLRQLASTTGTPLPASTETGEIFESFALGGQVSGPVDQIRLSDADIRLDEISGQGQFGLDMTGVRPKLTGQLALSPLDLRPYMAAYSAQRPEGGLQPWSTEPLPTESMKALDADLTLTTPSVSLTRLSLGQTRARLTVDDGVMTADVPELDLYGGSGRGRFTFNSRGQIPSIDVTASLNQLRAQNFLGAVAGFTKAQGTGTTDIALRGSGFSQADIIKSLTGDGNFSLRDGSIQGIDAGEFLSGLQQALTTRSLPAGIGPAKSTQFNTLLGNFSMDNGTAAVQQFTLKAANVEVDGSGQVDLGNQSIDFRFRPKAVGEQARGLASFGIPLRIAGPFNGASASLDSDFLGEVIQARAAAEAQNLITNALGGNRTGSSTSSSPTSGLLDSLLGSSGQASLTETDQNQSNATPDTQSENEPEAEEEPNVEDAILGLFGVKRDD